MLLRPPTRIPRAPNRLPGLLAGLSDQDDAGVQRCVDRAGARRHSLAVDVTRVGSAVADRGLLMDPHRRRLRT